MERIASPKAIWSTFVEEALRVIAVPTSLITLLKMSPWWTLSSMTRFRLRPTIRRNQAYRAFLHEEFPQARVCVLEHIAELVKLFDLCICIGFSLGIDKLVLLKPQVKSLGEIVGRHGRSPDPAKVAALSEWGPIGSLKQLQEFLGTANYSRDQIGPKFAVAMDPLRRYLREGDKAFPMTPRGLEAVERLKRLMRKATCLAVPDERAAANGSRPYEQLA